MIELHDCERKPGTRVSDHHCIKRQKFLEKKNCKTGWSAWQFRDIENLCKDCPTGVALYQNSKGEKDMRQCEDCGKHHPPTEEFFRKAGRGLSRTCRACEGTENWPINKKPEYADQPEVKVERKAAVAKSATVEPEAKPVTTDNEKLLVETKACAYERCGKIITRRPETSDNAWDRRKYCYDGNCAKRAELEQEARRRKLQRKGKAFDQDQAESIAREIITKELEYLSSLGLDIDVKMAQTVCERVSVECCRQMMGAA